MNERTAMERVRMSFHLDGILKIALGFDERCRVVVGCHNKCENEMFNKIIILSFSRTMCVIQWENVFVSFYFILFFVSNLIAMGLFEHKRTGAFALAYLFEINEKKNNSHRRHRNC